ncbi:hypothetical protein F8568_000540 [Actinomadura sp. LD22]|uniref:Uncharacterized protein n=1 Tax=Actinomadura physcomitrii TaxID=2650748 RepID=A0A6I4M3F9_9ACTN|nr:hypothetical protein [Actinomadura physcomitrii]MVZ98894.1 hypothetical protein [Actinomadura physcomitrii]
MPTVSSTPTREIYATPGTPDAVAPPPPSRTLTWSSFWISRRLPGARTVVLDLDPGIPVIAPGDWPEQRIKEVRIIPGHDPARRPGAHHSATFADLDAMNASELLTDLLHLSDGRMAT